ncbi:MAG: hypothetical protein NT155_01245 [Candidatus Staskawiczbacteria bacterium]|nr:hypothetical protein [Candidatus Staskawiczbacteria bacterium]
MNLVRNYSYYKKLGFNKPESWNSDDLSQFLIWDFLNAYSNTVMGKDIPESFIADSKYLAEKNSASQMFFDFLDEAIFRLQVLFNGKQSKKKVLFQNSRCPSVISETGKNYQIGLIDQGKRDRLFIRKDFSGYMNTNELNRNVFHYLKERNLKYLYRLIELVEKRLKIIKPDYIILKNDLLPVEKAIVLVARKLGITTMEIQDGILSMKYGPLLEPLMGGKSADYILVWGKHFKDLYVDNNIREPENVYVLGYPYSPKNQENKTDKKRNYVVCYLAQDFERFNKNFLKIKIETVKRLSLICKNLGLKFIYRPHPWGEDRVAMENNLSGVEFTKKNERIEETFSRADIFVGYSSTALVEAAMRKKIVLQLMDLPIELDNLEELGVCDKSSKSINELESYLTKMVESPYLKESALKFNNDYVETRDTPGNRFLGIISEIEEKKYGKSGRK